MNKTVKNILHKLFVISIIVKGIDGILDIIVAYLLLFKKNFIQEIIPWLFRNELASDPKDALGNYFINISQDITINTHWFVIIYLIGHGIVKITLALSFNNSRNYKIYHISSIVLAMFTIYQSYRFFHTYSILLLFLTLVDIFIIIMIRIDIKRLKAHRDII